MKKYKINPKFFGKVTVPILTDNGENRISLSENTSEEEIELLAKNEVGIQFLEEVKENTKGNLSKPM